jgi:hypothetical protein
MRSPADLPLQPQSVEPLRRFPPPVLAEDVVVLGAPPRAGLSWFTVTRRAA